MGMMFVTDVTLSFCVARILLGIAERDFLPDYTTLPWILRGSRAH